MQWLSGLPQKGQPELIKETTGALFAVGWLTLFVTRYDITMQLVGLLSSGRFGRCNSPGRVDIFYIKL